MIFGIGTDLVENTRMESWLARQGLLDKYFSVTELDDVLKSAHPAASLAARFAAKEAFGKALGSGLWGLALKDIEVCRSKGGKPSLRLVGTAEIALKKKGVQTVHLSLTHEKDYSLAFVVLEV